MTESVLKKLAKPLILAATLIWGSTFFIIKETLDDVDLMFLLAFRFTFAAAVLLSLEAPFGVAFSILLGGESPTPFMYFGFLLIFAAIVCSETKFDFFKSKKTASRR